MNDQLGPAPNQPPGQIPTPGTQPAKPAWDQTAFSWNSGLANPAGQAVVHHGPFTGPNPAELNQPMAPRYVDYHPGQNPQGNQPMPNFNTQFQMRKPKITPWLIVIVVIAVLATMLWYGTRPDPHSNETPASPSATSTPTPRKAGEYGGTGQFENSSVKGTFTVNHSHWEGDTLIVNVTVKVDEGSMDYSFLFMDVKNGDIYEYTPGVPGFLDDGWLDAGQSVTGNIACKKNRADTAVVLRTGWNTNLTSIPVKG